MGLADLHVHTTYSMDGTCTVSGVLKQVADFTSLTVVAITDHDEIRGALEALELAPSYGIDVVPGIEISTAAGHLLALYVHEMIPAHRPLKETLLRVGDLGGICVAAHPMACGLNSLNAKSIREALDDPDTARVLVGIESYNAGIVIGRTNLAAHNLARSLPVAQVGGSDAHVAWAVGLGATKFPGVTAADLRLALESANTEVVAGQRVGSVRLIGGWLPRFLLRRAGWVTWNQEPQLPLRLSRLARSA